MGQNDETVKRVGSLRVCSRWQHAHVVEQRRRGAATVRIQYRSGNGEAVDTTLDRVMLDELVGGLPVREFRWYRDRKHYSG